MKHELSVLSATRRHHLSGIEGLTDLAAQLKTINEALWEIEDDIRACEARRDGQKFIDLARAVYITNDKRAAVKKEINLLTGANIIEEKSYEDFDQSRSIAANTSWTQMSVTDGFSMTWYISPMPVFDAGL